MFGGAAALTLATACGGGGHTAPTGITMTITTTTTGSVAPAPTDPARGGEVPGGSTGGGGPGGGGGCLPGVGCAGSGVSTKAANAARIACQRCCPAVAGVWAARLSW